MQNRFAEILKLLLKQHDMTQTQLGDVLGLSRNTISTYIQDLARPNIDTVIKIASYFGVSTDYLLTGESLENKITRDELGLPEKALRTLPVLAKTDKGKITLSYIGDLICDDEFIETLNATIERFQIEIKAFHRPKKLSLAEQIETMSYMEYSENKAAMKMCEYFRGFFKRLNVFRPHYRKFTAAEKTALNDDPAVWVKD